MSKLDKVTDAVVRSKTVSKKVASGDSLWTNDPPPRKTFKEKITETRQRRNKLMKMMEETIKAKFDDKMQEEAVEIENPSKKKRTRNDAFGNSLEDLDLL